MHSVKSVMGLVNLQKKDTLIKELTENRPIASIPFAGRYRIIDFALSSMVNSGIGNVGILLPEKSRSVLDHLRSGKDWDLARRHEGLCYLPAFLCLGVIPVVAGLAGEVLGSGLL